LVSGSSLRGPALRGEIAETVSNAELAKVAEFFFRKLGALGV
jgi:hypothetical protein